MKFMMIPLLVCCLPLFAQELPTQGDGESFATYLDQKAQVLSKENGSLGIAVALLSQGQPTLVKGYGMANLNDKKPVTADTVFNIGSIAKTLAAWGVMIMVQDGKVDLDAPVETYLKSWKLPKTEYENEGVTVRRLLSHTAGLSVHGYPGFFPEEKRPNTVDSLRGKGIGNGATTPVQLIMTPGSKWKYSGGGYTILQLMIEDMSGMPFHQYMEEKVFNPLGMHHSAYTLPPHIAERMAACYGYLRNEIPLRRFTAEAAASLKVSLNDFVRFARASIPKAAGGTGGGGVLTEATLKIMYTRPPNSPNYGLGYSVRQMEDGYFVGHGGDNAGWHARFRVKPETGEGIVIFTNSDTGTFFRKGLECAWQDWLGGKKTTTCFEPNLFTILNATYLDKGFAAMMDLYRKEKRSGQKENQLNARLLDHLGYSFLHAGLVEDAVKCFELNVAEYPDAANPWDSLGEGYMKQKRYKLAIENYQKSLQLNPNNSNAVKMIARIKQMLE